MKQNEKGFSLVEILIVLIVVCLLSSVTWYVLNANQKTSNKSKTTTQSQTVKSNSTTPTTVAEESKVQPTEKPAATTPAPSASQPSTSTTPPAQTPAPVTAKIGSAYAMYRIAADGSSAQASPVSTTLKDVSSVELTVDLQCPGTCQFKLVSDNYTFSDTTVYTSSQKIKYTIKNPGSYVLKNQFTATGFIIKF